MHTVTPTLVRWPHGEGGPDVHYDFRRLPVRPRWADRALRQIRPSRRERELRRLESLTGRRGSDRPVAVVYGNCQAGPLSTLLATSDEFASAYNLVRIPPAHELTRAEAIRVREALPRVGLLITQQIKAGYRGLPIGTDDFTTLLPTSAKVLRYPVMYWEGAYPFQIYVRTTGELSQAAPLTDYADLRLLAFAARGLDRVQAREALVDYSPPLDAVRAQHERSIGELRSREMSLDVGVSDLVITDLDQSPSFHTVNHPSNRILQSVTSRLLGRLGLDQDSLGTAPRPEFLARLLTPVEPEIIDALSAQWQVRTEWEIGGARMDESAILEAHFEWFDRDPDVVHLGAKQHRERIERFGLG